MVDLCRRLFTVLRINYGGKERAESSMTKTHHQCDQDKRRDPSAFRQVNVLLGWDGRTVLNLDPRIARENPLGKIICINS